MREEQQKDRNRVTRRSGTKMFGNAATQKNAERIHAFDDDRQQEHDAGRNADRVRDEHTYARGQGRDAREDRDSSRYRDEREARDGRLDREDDRPYDDGARSRRRAEEGSEGRTDKGQSGARRAAGEDKPRTQNKASRPANDGTELFVHQVVPYVMFWLALFAAVSFVLRDIAGLHASAGAFGNWLADFLCGILGIGAYVLPLFLIVLSLKWKRFVRQGILGKKLFLSSAFILLLSGVIHVFQDVDRARRIATPAILYAEGVTRSGGGFFGGFVGEWLGYCLRLPGTCLLAVPLLIIIGIYLVGLTPSGLWQRIDAKLQMSRHRRREERGAKGGKPADPAARSALTKAKAQESADWKEPQPLKRGGAVYDFGEDEPDVEIDLVHRRAAAAEEMDKADELPRAARHTNDAMRARRNSEVHEILDIPDDEPEMPDASPEALTILAEAGHIDDAKRQMDDILRDMTDAAEALTPTATPVAAPTAPAYTAAAPAAEAVSVSPKEGEESRYYAPFALPVRPEPRRERAAEPDHSHIVITPHAEAPVASDAPVVSEAPAAACASTRHEAVPQWQNEEGEETLGNVPTSYQPVSRSSYREEPVAFAAPQPIYREEPAAPAADEWADESEAPVTPTQHTQHENDLWESEKEPAAPAKSVFDSLFEEDDAVETEPPAAAAPVWSAGKPSRSVFVEAEPYFAEDDEEECADIAMPVPAVRERVEPAPVFTAPAPTRYEPPRRQPVAKVEPVRDEAPPAPVAVRKEYARPPITLLNEDKNVRNGDFYEEIEDTKQILRDTLESFNIHIQDEVAYSHGPSVTRYELRPVAGTSVRSVTNRIEDISLNLASAVRIEAPIPGKPAIGIEVPNKVRETVYMRTMLESEEFKSSTDPLEVPLGLDVGGTVKMCNLAKMPHLLVAGTTGSGKSVCINSILVSLIYKTSPEDLRLILIDPKQIEFAPYEHVPHLYMPIVTDMQRAAGALACAVQEMERRFTLIKDVRVRDIEAYNEAVKNDPDREHLPYMIIVIDEFADLKMSCSNNDPENFTCRIAQKARAAGIHLIIGTQRPSVDVITGKLKTNIPSRIAFMVKQQVDSRTILDVNGAESLTGRGDMLYMPSNSSDKAPNRIQGAFVSDGELERVISYVRKNNDPVQYNQAFMDQIEIEMAKAQNNGKKQDVDDFDDDGEGNEDPKFVEAVKLAVETQKVATSLLQRRLGVGYGRAAKIIDRMEDLGLVSAPDGNKPRQILPAAQGYLNHLAAEEDGDSDDFNDYQ